MSLFLDFLDCLIFRCKKLILSPTKVVAMAQQALSGETVPTVLFMAPVAAAGLRLTTDSTLEVAATALLGTCELLAIDQL